MQERDYKQEKCGNLQDQVMEVGSDWPEAELRHGLSPGTHLRKPHLNFLRTETVSNI